MAYKEIAYEPHPVSPERKRELNAKGFKIMDIVFAPEGYKSQRGQAQAQEPEQEQRKQRGRTAHVANDEGEE